MTTTDLSPEEIHQMGLKQVSEIEGDMLTIAQQQGFSDLKTFNEHIRNDRHFYATSGQQLLDLYQHYADQMYEKLPQLFGRLPKNKLVVVPMETYRSADAVPADYSIGAGDNSLPGRINVNEYDPPKRLLLNVEAIAYHEGVPGTICSSRSQTNSPTCRPSGSLGFTTTLMRRVGRFMRSA